MSAATFITILFIAVFIFTMIVVWSFIGLFVVLYYDLFGRRYDYDQDYKLTKSELWAAGPIVWYLERGKKK